MLVTADHVLPIASPPIAGGAVLVRDDRIVAVGPAASLLAEHPSEPVQAFPGCALLPGLVNAHTHLALTALEALIPPMPFHEWMPRLVRGLRSWKPDDVAASAALGVRHCLGAGVTVVGDIAYGPASPLAALDAGLGGVFFWEVLGAPGDELPRLLAEHAFPDAEPPAWAPRVRRGLSPHAPYSSPPTLLAAAAEYARAHGLALMVHAAESPAETELLLHGSGPLAPVASRLVGEFEPPRVPTLPYFARVGVLDGAVVVHLSQARVPEDVALVAEQARGAVLCPRSNEHLHNGEAPVQALADAGVLLGVGTDSSASNEDLDLMEDVRALARLAPALPAEALVRAATLDGARVLGVDDTFGSLEAGKQADLALFALPDGASSDLERAVLRTAGRHTLRAVLSAGVWRVRDGSPVTGDAAVRRAASLATEKAASAIAETP